VGGGEEGRKRDGGQESESKEAHPRAFARNPRRYDERGTVDERERDGGRGMGDRLPQGRKSIDLAS